MTNKNENLNTSEIAETELVGKKKLSIDPNKVTLLRRTKSTLQVTGAQSHGQKTVNVEVRRKHTYVKRRLLMEQEKKEEEAKQAELQAEATARLEKEKLGPSVPTRPKTEKERVAEKLESPSEKTKQGEKKPAVQVVGDIEGIDKKTVLANLERQKMMEKLMSESEEGEKAKKRTKVRVGEKERGRKKIDLRHIQLDEEGELPTGAGGTKSYAVRKPIKWVQSFIPSGEFRKQEFEKPVEPIVREVSIPETITVHELAQRMAVKASAVIKVLMKLGVMATINQVLDRDTAVLVVGELGHTVKLINENEVEQALLKEEAITGKKESRPPVVTIMGHVDHGKTTLLDAIRKTRIAEGEAGGITQHIGAYHVKTPKGIITFLDTPGHEAFTAMRARGAKVTDIVVLVVAADDGIMPQTIEAIQHAKAAHVPIIVALNKMDKPGADPEKVRLQLSQHEVISEEWGGQSMFVPISAKQGTGIDKLLEAILLQAEMLELKAVRNRPAKGVVIESRLDKNKGPIATLLVQQGTLHRGDILLAGQEYGRVRAMIDDRGQKTEETGPSIPVEVLGLSGTPKAGDEFLVVRDERTAKEVALYRHSKSKASQLAHATGPVKVENLFESLDKQQAKVMNIILKTDVQGSLEALKDMLMKLNTEEVQLRVISSGIGGITESDVNLAIASHALLIGFNVRPDLTAKKLIESSPVEVRYYSIIYDVLEDMKKSMGGLLTPEVKEKIIGLAEVRQVFRSSKLGTIAGCMVLDGVVKRNKPIHILRNHVVIHEGEIESLRHLKEDVSEIRQNMECGIGIKNYTDIQVGDQIEVFERITVERKL